MAENTQEEPFPWHLGVFDAHCHPTDTMSSISTIPKMKARVLTVMATRGQDQQLVSSVAEDHYIKSPNPADWKPEERIIPCWGWHPWFSHQMYVADEDNSFQTQEKEGKNLQGEDKIRHYHAVLRSNRATLSDEDRRHFLSFPDPMPLSRYLAQTRTYLERYPLALVGEIGLDSASRIPVAPDADADADADAAVTPGGRDGRRLTPFRTHKAHQKKVFKLQLQLAAEMGRAVSIHGVQLQGTVFEVLRELYAGHERKFLSRRERKKRGIDEHGNDEPIVPVPQTSHPHAQPQPRPYPPRICLHSYSGTPADFNMYLNRAIPMEIFVSFSAAVHLGGKQPGFEDMVRFVPDDMVLVESDLHTAGPEMDDLLEVIVRRVCRVKGWGLEDGVRRLGRNWKRFVFGEEREGMGTGRSE